MGGQNRLQLTLTIADREVRHSRIQYSEYGDIEIEHTRHIEDSRKMMEYAEQLYNEAKQETDPTLIMQKAGKIFWLICQAKPWLRGDPSIAEMLVKTLLAAKGIELSLWKIGIVPWEEVMKESDSDLFAAKFAALMSPMPASSHP